LSAKPAYEYHLKNWSDIQGHLPRLFAAAKGNCMEIGVRSGVSTSALLAGLEEHGGKLQSVDINNCPVFAGHPQWEFHNVNSQTINILLEGEVLDLLFIDGDHSYMGALADLLNYGSRAKRIFVHDTDAPDYPGVRQAVEEFAKETGRKVTYHSGSYGMAEIQ
jgi:hypothetical protein